MLTMVESEQRVRWMIFSSRYELSNAVNKHFENNN